MARLLEIGGTNAVFATLLAIVVWAIVRHWRQPAFVHFLWIVVLAKLITPPLVAIPWWAPNDEAGKNSQILSVGDDLSLAPTTVQIAAAKFAAAQTDATGSDVAVATSPAPNPRFANIPWSTCIGTLWLTGSAIWLAIAVGRLTRFHFALSDAGAPSAELQRLADEVSAQVGVRRYRVRVTSGQISPLVWPIGRPTIVVPQNLLEVLTEPELRAIVTHEFAHLRRKDHWVRWLELTVTAIYWWHPVVWYVRRQIQQAEESACDAWVLRSNPAAAKEYATALFQAVQLATETLRPASVLASRVTSNGDLKERIENVLNSKWHAEISTWTRRGLWLTTLCVLPLSLTSVYASDTSEITATEDSLALPAQVSPPLDQRNPRAHVQERQIVEPEIDDASVLREQITFLDEQFKRTDALYKTGAPGGTVDRWAMTGYELAKARGELALVEGNRADAIAQFSEAEEFAGTSLKATDAAYLADRVTLDALLAASKNLTDVRRRLIQLRRAPISAPEDPADVNIEANLRRALAEQSSSESNTLSLAYYRKAIEQQRMNVERLQMLASKQVVSASEVAMAKAEHELLVEGRRQTERKLESRQLLVQLAKVEYAQAIEANKQAPGALNELEVRRKKLLVDLAEAKVRELRE